MPRPSAARIQSRASSFFVSYTVEGMTYHHDAPQTRADMCDKKPWRVTYVAGNPDAWAVAPDSPLPPFEDNIDGIWIVIGPCLFVLAAVYWLFTLFQERRAGKEAQLAEEGGLLGAELVQAKYYAGDDAASSIRLKFTMTPPKGQPVERKQILLALRPRSPGAAAPRQQAAGSLRRRDAAGGAVAGWDSRLGRPPARSACRDISVTTQLPSTAPQAIGQREQRGQIAAAGSCGSGPVAQSRAWRPPSPCE